MTQQPVTWLGTPRGSLVPKVVSSRSYRREKRDLSRASKGRKEGKGREGRVREAHLSARKGENRAINVKSTRVFFVIDVSLYDKGDWRDHWVFYFPLEVPLSRPSTRGLIRRLPEGGGGGGVQRMNRQQHSYYWT